VRYARCVIFLSTRGIRVGIPAELSPTASAAELVHCDCQKLGECWVAGVVVWILTVSHPFAKSDATSDVGLEELEALRELVVVHWKARHSRRDNLAEETREYKRAKYDCKGVLRELNDSEDRW